MIGKFPPFKISFHIQINNVIFNSIKLTNTPDGVVKLEIAQAQPSDCGAYKLVISNPNGESAALCAVAIKRTFSKLAILLHSNNVVLIFFCSGTNEASLHQAIERFEGCHRTANQLRSTNIWYFF